MPESVKKVGGEWNGWRRTHYFNGRPEKRGNNAVSNGQRAITLIPVSSIRGRPAAQSLALLAPIFDSFSAIMSKFLKVPGCQREKYWQILIRGGGGRDPWPEREFDHLHKTFEICMTRPSAWPGVWVILLRVSHTCEDCVSGLWRLWLIRLCHKIAFLHWEPERPDSLNVMSGKSLINTNGFQTVSSNVNWLTWVCGRSKKIALNQEKEFKISSIFKSSSYLWTETFKRGSGL